MRGPTGTVLLRIALLAAALVAAGCSDDRPEAGRLPSNSPSPTTSSASPSPTTPEEQIEAAVRAYYAELTRAAQTNDTSVLRTMTTQGCPCRRPVRVIDGFEKRDWSAPEASFDVTFVSVRSASAQEGVAEVKTNDAAYDVVAADGKVVDSIQSRKTHVDLSLVRVDSGGWVIANEVDLRG